MQQEITFTGGEVLTPEGFQAQDLSIAGGVISDQTGGSQIDCSGYKILPGIVDVHGDAFELAIFPRPGTEIDFNIAMSSVDRQLLAHGITTAFHGLTISWEPGARSLDAGRRFMAGLEALRPRLMADHRVQLRWETFAHDAIEDIAGWLAGDPTPSLAFNDHTTATLAMMDTADQAKLNKWSQRAGVGPDEYMASAAAVGERREEVPAKIREVAEIAHRHGAVLLSHDDRTAEERQNYRALGAKIAEFPLDRTAAAEANAAGEPVIMGGPNVIRGGSHIGMLSAEQAVREGLCTILASDYYYPSQINAAQRLVNGGIDLAEAWALISANPAEAMGLTDRGRIAAGLRADLVVLDCNGPWRLVHTVTNGVVTSFGR